GQVRRERAREPDTSIEHFHLLALSQVAHGGRVVVALDAGLNRLPVAQSRLPAITVQTGGRDNRLADVGISSGYEDSVVHALMSASVENSAAAKRRSVVSSRSTLTEIRRRAVPGGTVGGRTARTSKPASCNAAATAVARRLSPIITGMICEPPDSIGAPPSVSRSRNKPARFSNRARRSGSLITTSRAAWTAAAIAGGGAVEKISGRARCTI